MLYAGLDLSRKRINLDARRAGGEPVERGACPPDADGLRGLADRLLAHDPEVLAVVESMNGARFVHDELERYGLDVLIADAERAKGPAPLACKTDRIDAYVLSELARRDLVPEIWLPDPGTRADRERARFRLHLVRKRTALKNRVHSTLIAFGKPCPVSDLFGRSGRELLARLEVPEPWSGTLAASVRLIGLLDKEISSQERELRQLGADHRYIPLLTTVPGIAWVLGFTIACEIGEIERFPTPKKLVGYTGLCPKVDQSGERRLARAAQEERAALSALGADRGGPARRSLTALPRALPAHAEAPRPPARPKGRGDRRRAQARGRDLAHAHLRQALRSGKRHERSGGMTAHK